MIIIVLRLLHTLATENLSINNIDYIMYTEFIYDKQSSGSVYAKLQLAQ